MVRRFYICGGVGEGDPAVGTVKITDSFFEGKAITGVFKEGDRYFIPGVEYNFDGDTNPLGTTITILNGTKFSLDEVIAVEVSEKKNLVDGCAGPVEDGADPYLPYIFKCVVARVNSHFANRDYDPFEVHYNYGLYKQVGNDKLKDGSGFLMVWLVMPYTEIRKRHNAVYSDVNDLRIVIAMSTEPNYTQAERDEHTIFPRLMPVYQKLIEEIGKEPKFGSVVVNEHKKVILPYWGGGDVNGPGANNLWKKNADCIEISNLKLCIDKYDFPYCP